MHDGLFYWFRSLSPELQGHITETQICTTAWDAVRGRPLMICDSHHAAAALLKIAPLLNGAAVMVEISDLPTALAVGQATEAVKKTSDKQ
ncbi:hypothetical protein H6F75_26640 [Nodosilinea sp. FACHB-131]|uniref:hypothetical protein n=1 Tax=Cyanophyceae TaxID=3028117 RepID=UPI0016869032|nr:hypothetical protein [Nodosilinea sp. FACHB-131]MBD1877068.1 hypothetical protein [Nodosilinea sp. FACHB-131]